MWSTGGEQSLKFGMKFKNIFLICTVSTKGRLVVKPKTLVDFLWKCRTWYRPNNDRQHISNLNGFFSLNRTLGGARSNPFMNWVFQPKCKGDPTQSSFKVKGTWSECASPSEGFFFLFLLQMVFFFVLRRFPFSRSKATERIRERTTKISPFSSFRWLNTANKRETKPRRTWIDGSGSPLLHRSGIVCCFCYFFILF